VEFLSKLKADLAPPEPPADPAPVAATGWATDAAAAGVGEVTGIGAEETSPLVTAPANGIAAGTGLETGGAEPILEAV
jgi:hypothetical protein